MKYLVYITKKYNAKFHVFFQNSKRIRVTEICAIEISLYFTAKNNFEKILNL